MRKQFSWSLVFIIASMILPATQLAAKTKSKSLEEVAKMAEAIPSQIPQILSGGYWKFGTKSGSFRAIVVSSGQNDSPTVDVFIQWIEALAETGTSKVLKTVAVKEVRKNKLSNAFIYMEGEDEGEITIVITSYDPTKDKDTQIWLRATTPGRYKVVPADAAPAENAN